MRCCATATACARCASTAAKGAIGGLTDNCGVPVPVTETPADIAAAKAWFIDRNAQVLGAIHAGKYTDSFLQRVGANAPEVKPGDFALISLPTDFLGLNIYSGTFVRAGKNGAAYEALPAPTNYPHADSPGCAWYRSPSTGYQALGRVLRSQRRSTPRTAAATTTSLSSTARCSTPPPRLPALLPARGPTAPSPTACR